MPDSLPVRNKDQHYSGEGFGIIESLGEMTESYTNS